MQIYSSFATKIAKNAVRTKNPISLSSLRKPCGLTVTLTIPIALIFATTKVIGSFVQAVEATPSTPLKDSVRYNAQFAYANWQKFPEDGSNIHTTLISTISEKEVRVAYSRVITYSDGSGYSIELHCSIDSLPMYCSGSPVTISRLPSGEYVFTILEPINDEVTAQSFRWDISIKEGTNS